MCASKFKGRLASPEQVPTYIISLIQHIFFNRLDFECFMFYDELTIISRVQKTKSVQSLCKVRARGKAKAVACCRLPRHCCIELNHGPYSLKPTPESLKAKAACRATAADH